MLFTVQEFKEHEGISGTADDAFLAALALRVSAAVDRYLNRTVESPPVDQVEYLDGSGTSSIWVKNPPIISVTSIHVDSSRAWSTGLVPATGFVVYRDEGRMELVSDSGVGQLFGSSAFWPLGAQNVRVIYRGGWVAGSIPLDIVEGAILWASTIMRRRQAAGVTSISVGSYSESYGGTEKFPDVSRQLLNRFRLPPNLAGVSR